MTERRRKRSSHLQTALTLLLDACRTRAGAEALVVADDQGMLVGGVASDRRELRFEAALLLHPEARRHSFRLADTRLHVGALGTTAAKARPHLEEAARGVARILG